MTSGPDYPPHPQPSAPSSGSAPTVLAMPRRDRWVMLVGLPVAGVVLSLLLPVLARWLLGLSTGLPLKPMFWFLGGIDNWWKVLAAASVGALAGLGAATRAAKRAATVKVGDADLVVEVDGRHRTIVRADIDAVFLDGKNLVVQDAGTRRLFSAPVEAPRHAIAQAFRERGYRWLEGDPSAGQYRQWRAASTELPTEVHAVLTAREAALRKRSTEEVDNLAEALQRLGYAVREEGTRQHWRPLAR